MQRSPPGCDVGVCGGFGITAVVYVAIAGLVLWMAQRMRERRTAQEQLAPGD